MFRIVQECLCLAEVYVEEIFGLFGHASMERPIQNPSINLGALIPAPKHSWRVSCSVLKLTAMLNHNPILAESREWYLECINLTESLPTRQTNAHLPYARQCETAAIKGLLVGELEGVVLGSVGYSDFKRFDP